MKFKSYKQLDVMDCGPTCLRMVAKFYGKNIGIQTLREATSIDREGVSMMNISKAAESVGFITRGVRINPMQLIKQVELPCILHWDQQHFVVLHKIKRDTFYIADPQYGELAYPSDEFLLHWTGVKKDSSAVGTALLLEPTNEFYKQEEDEQSEIGLIKLLGYLTPYKKLIIQLFLGIIVTNLLQLVLPFLTQSIVDIGINSSNLDFIYLILAGQFSVLLGRLFVDSIRSWILLHISSRINIRILSEFLAKIMRLPLSYFDVKVIGDFMQRINDQRRIEQFLTGTSLETLFSFVSLLVFGSVLYIFSAKILLVYSIGTLLYVCWVMLFLSSRKQLDIKRFKWLSKEQSVLVELMTGMQEIKLANAEIQKRWWWEDARVNVFKFSIQGLALTQYQSIGGRLLHEGTNILTTFLSAKYVITGNMTLGTMLAVQYMVGQLNGPIESFISFLQAVQDAKLSLERLEDIHHLPNEYAGIASFSNEHLESDSNLELENVSFTYVGKSPVLKNISLTIPRGRITAIVGMSGSGKTTLLKLLLKYYEVSQGKIRLGNHDFDSIPPDLWRSKCGVVLQDGFIFSDTIAKNIAVGEEYVNESKLKHAIEVANIKDYIDELPLGYKTKIGAEGNGLSQGQKQRILIARAVYKDPDFIFFDEATNSLDANNEGIIMSNLDKFFAGKTVLVVAHRLSTIKNADQIVVLGNGTVLEVGSHNDLLKLKGHYYKLINNQLETKND
jgi:ATP-binding cassette subfamily B protein